MSNLFVPIKKAELSWKNALPYSLHYQDIYHSAISGINQSLYVFIDGNHLIERWKSLTPGQSFTVAETGFGTGLNFLVSWKLWEEYAPANCHLHYISCEKHPLALNDLVTALDAWPELQKYAVQLIASYPILTPGYHQLCFAEKRVTLTLMLGDALESYEQLLICGEPKLEQSLRTAYIDAWFLDGFAPAKNESMWSDSLIKVIAQLSKKGTTLATYTASGLVKKNLNEHGFVVEKRKGFGPKRHMLTACFSPVLEQKHQKKYTPWHMSAKEKNQQQSAVIVGAGLAGCFTAYALAKRGWKVTLIDELNEVGLGGSANKQAVLFPKLSAYSSPLTQFMLAAFLYAVRTYQNILSQCQLGALTGALVLAHNEKEQAAQTSLKSWLSHYPELGALVDVQTASEIAGLSLTQPGLFIPLSGWINSPALCRFLIETQGITVLANTPVHQFTFDKRWIINEMDTQTLILANGHKINSFAQTEYLPIKPIRGQMTSIATTAQSAPLKLPLCASGHVLPASADLHLVGATYELKTKTTQIQTQDDLINLAQLKKLAPEVSWSDKVVDHWAGSRAATPDYLPLVGQIAKEQEFNQLFAKLETNANLWIGQAGPYYPGLYACAGFGSRGLTSIPLCAEWLASLINNEISCLPRNLQQALSPARFLRRAIIRGHKK